MKWHMLKAALQEGRLRCLLWIQQTLLQSGPEAVTRTMIDLALALRQQHRCREAEAIFADALETRRAHKLPCPAKSLSMQLLVDGVQSFRNNEFAAKRALFEELAKGQHPDVLLITCSDSRLGPYHITQQQPGELFIIRNAGNIVPVYNTTSGGGEASIEFAIKALGVKNIIIKGHSHCGAMKGLLHPEKVADMPKVAAWIEHAHEVREHLACCEHLSEDDRLMEAIKQNVLVQIEHLKTHPAVAEALAAGKLQLHGWVYVIEEGNVMYFDEETAAWQTM